MTIYSRKIELEEYLEGLKLLIYSKKEQLVNYTMTIRGGSHFSQGRTGNPVKRRRVLQ